MNILFEVEKSLIVIVALLLAYTEFALAIEHRRDWVKWGLGIMGVYWAVYYSYSIYRSLTGMRFQAHQIFVRSGLLITIALVASGAFMTLRKTRELKRLRKW